MNCENNDGDTVLHCACSKSFAKMADALVKSAADITKKNKRGETPLHVSVRYLAVAVGNSAFCSQSACGCSTTLTLFFFGSG